MIQWPEPTLFNLLNLALGLALMVFLVRYLWLVVTGSDRRPAAWQLALREKRISPALLKCWRSYPDKIRFLNFWLQSERLMKESVPGDFAEVGVYRGESARVLHLLDPGRVLHLFDTFSGFPAEDLRYESGEAATYTPESFRDTSSASVLKKLGNPSGVIVHEGYFPATAAGLKGPFALVNLDADLYRPTREALAFFYPLLSPGGVILVHDYNHRWPGIMKAVDEFCTGIPEHFILLPDTNGTAVLIKNGRIR